MVIHHTGCGMLTFKNDELKQSLIRETGIRPPFAMEAFSDLEEDVRQSIERIKSSPFIPCKDQIRGFVYEVESGRIRAVS
jgi:carbonic anhydrase